MIYEYPYRLVLDHPSHPGSVCISLGKVFLMCKHFWVIDPPNGPTSKGTCKLCGDEQEFSNSGPDDSPRIVINPASIWPNTYRFNVKNKHLYHHDQNRDFGT